MTIEQYPKGSKRSDVDNEDDKYLRKYKKIDYYDDTDEEFVR